MLQEFRFRVNLLHDGTTYQDPTEVLDIANTKTIYLPLHLGNIPMRALKHDDVFTLQGIAGARLKALVESQRIFNIEMYEEPEEEEVISGLQLVGLNEFGFQTLTLSSSNLVVGGYVYTFDGDDINVINIDSMANEAYFASDGEYSYVLMRLDNNDFRFFKVSGSGEVTLLDLPEFEFVHGDRTEINDGLDDMYDGGNILNTNLANAIIYTHNPNASDGEIVDGETWFGEGSQYFTNNNNGIFSLVATNLDIETFSISGNIGADGEGFVKHDRIVIETEPAGPVYSVFYKCVYDAGDPSINHLIIIPGDHDLTHVVPDTTNNDDHSVEGLLVTDRIAYLLFATNNANSEVSELNLTQIAQAFIVGTDFGTASISEIKSDLDSIGSDLADLIDGQVLFDDGDGASGTGGFDESLKSLVYIGDGKLALLNGNDYTVLSTSGEVLSSSGSNAYVSINDLVYYEDELYGFGYSNVLYKIVDKDTGEVFGDGSEEDKKSNILTWKEGSAEDFDIAGMFRPFVHDGRLFALVEPVSFDEEADGGHYSVVEVFPETNEINYISFFIGRYIDAIGEAFITGNQNDEIGMATSTFIDYFESYGGTSFDIDQDRLYKTPTIDNLVLQWIDSEIDYDENSDWADVTITDIVYSESNRDYEITYTEPSESGYDLRIRYSDGELWFYIDED